MKLGGFLKKTTSYFYPLNTDKRHSTFAGSLEVRLENGRKVLNGPGSNYSFGRLEEVFRKALAYYQFRPEAHAQVLLLGFGGGSLVKILRETYAFHGPLTAVEIDPAVIHLAQKHYPRYLAGVDLHLADAEDFLKTHPARYDYIFTDLFIDDKVPTQFCTENWVQNLHRHLHRSGCVFHNVMISKNREKSLLAYYHKHFNKVMEFRKYGTNLVINAQN